MRDSGCDVLAAKDATEALVMMEGVKLDVILLDLDLDGEDGLMLMKFLKCNEPDVPIIIYTGLRHSDDEIVEMLRQGAHQYVQKGPLEDLRKAVQGVMR